MARPIYRTGDTSVNILRTTVLSSLGLGLVLQAAPAGAWWQSYYQSIPYGHAPIPMSYQSMPGVLELWPGQAWLSRSLAPLASPAGPQFWQYPTLPYGPTSMWSSAMTTAGLYVQQNEIPAGYQIRVHTGQLDTPALDIGVQGGFLTIRTRSLTRAGGGNGMPMQQLGWATQSISLPTDANVAAMQLQQGDGVVEIFIPRGR